MLRCPNDALQTAILIQAFIALAAVDPRLWVVDDDPRHVGTDPRSSLFRSSWKCQRSRWIVASVEDALRGRQECDSEHLLHFHRSARTARCNCPFGRLLAVPRTGEGAVSMYLHIWKNGGHAVKEALRDHEVHFETLRTDEPSEVHSYATYFGEPFEQYVEPLVSERGTNGIYAFTFVRHPVWRFFSAYGTIIDRLLQAQEENCGCLSRQLQRILLLDEPERFDEFVSAFTALGDRIVEHYRCADHRCIFAHAFSQVWFLNLWPGRFAYIGRFEQMSVDWARIADWLGLANASLPWRNVGEGASIMSQALWNSLLARRSSIQKLHDYYALDFKVLGYASLPGYRLRTDLSLLAEVRQQHRTEEPLTKATFADECIDKLRSWEVDPS